MSAETSGSDRDTEGQDADVLALMREIGPIVEERRHYGLNREDAEVYARTVLASDWLAAYIARKVEKAERESEARRQHLNAALQRENEVRAELAEARDLAVKQHSNWMEAARLASAEWDAERDSMLPVASAAETIKQTGGAVEIAGVRIEPCDEYGATETTKALAEARSVIERVTALQSDLSVIGTLNGHEVPMPMVYKADLRAALAPAGPRCGTCRDAGTVEWMVEADPNCYQELDGDGRIPCPDCASDRPLTLDEHLTSGERCSPLHGSCALLPGHVGPHHGYPENIAAVERHAVDEHLAEVERRIKHKLGITSRALRVVRAYREEVRRG